MSPAQEKENVVNVFSITGEQGNSLPVILQRKQKGVMTGQLKIS